MRLRIQRVNQLLKREISQIFLREIEFPSGTLVTVTRVESSSNLIQAKVYVSCMPEERASEILRILNQRIYNIQQILNKRLEMRPIPRIKFLEEKETKEAGRIEELLKRVKQQG